MFFLKYCQILSTFLSRHKGKIKRIYVLGIRELELDFEWVETVLDHSELYVLSTVLPMKKVRGVRLSGQRKKRMKKLF